MARVQVTETNLKSIKVAGCQILAMQMIMSTNEAVVLVSGWNDVTPFVTWKVNLEDGSCYYGEYLREEHLAWGNYKARTEAQTEGMDIGDIPLDEVEAA